MSEREAIVSMLRGLADAAMAESKTKAETKDVLGCLVASGGFGYLSGAANLVERGDHLRLQGAEEALS